MMMSTLNLSFLYWLKNHGSFPCLGLDVYNTRILYVLAGTRWNYGLYRLGMVEDHPFSVCAKRIPGLEYGGWSLLETAGDCPVFG